MGRKAIEIDANKLTQKLKELPTQNDVADYFGVSQGTISNKIREYKIGPKLKNRTEKRPKLEMPEFSYEESKKILIELEEKTEEKIGYNEVDIEIETNRPIGIIPLSDTHIGARYVYYKRLFETVDFIHDNPYIFTTLNGDFADNYTTSAYKAGQIEQKIPIQEQKAHMESIIKKISTKILGMINGCHDEWSYLNDGFDFAQYLSHKAIGYYMGHNGLINLKVGDIIYKIYMTHNTNRNSILNPGHGLACVCKDIVNADIVIGGHIHQSHFEQRVIRGEMKTLVICGGFKGEDRHGSKSGFSPLLGIIPGFILNPKKFEVIGSINYKDVMKYL